MNEMNDPIREELVRWRQIGQRISNMRRDAAGNLAEQGPYIWECPGCRRRIGAYDQQEQLVRHANGCWVVQADELMQR